MDFSSRTGVKTGVAIAILFGVTLIGLLVGVFILNFSSIGKSIDSCTQQGGVEIEKNVAVLECPSGYTQLSSTESSLCCLKLS